MTHSITSNESVAISATAIEFARELIENMETTSPRDLLLRFGTVAAHKIIATSKTNLLNLNAQIHVDQITFKRPYQGMDEKELAEFVDTSLETSLIGGNANSSTVKIKLQGAQVEGTLSINAFVQQHA